jgi:hypothetical protein
MRYLTMARGARHDHERLHLSAHAGLMAVEEPGIWCFGGLQQCLIERSAKPGGYILDFEGRCLCKRANLAVLEYPLVMTPGEARAIVHRMVWRSISRAVLESGPHDMADACPMQGSKQNLPLGSGAHLRATLARFI